MSLSERFVDSGTICCCLIDVSTNSLPRDWMGLECRLLTGERNLFGLRTLWALLLLVVNGCGSLLVSGYKPPLWLCPFILGLNDHELGPGRLEQLDKHPNMLDTTPLTWNGHLHRSLLSCGKKPNFPPVAFAVTTSSLLLKSD